MRALDRIQRRYSYTDEYLLNMPYARLAELMRLTLEWEYEEQRQRYREQALVSWRIESRLAGMFAGKDDDLQLPTLAEYWDDIGIGDGSTIEARKGEEVETAAEAMEKVRDIFGATDSPPLPD